MDSLTDGQKTQKGYQIFELFAQEFGDNDIFKEVFFEIFLEAIYGKENRDDIPIPREKGQERNSDHQCIGEGEMPTYKIE